MHDSMNFKDWNPGFQTIRRILNGRNFLVVDCSQAEFLNQTFCGCALQAG